MTEDELDHTIASLILRGYIVISGVVDGEPQYEVTDKGRFALAEAQWKAA